MHLRCTGAAVAVLAGISMVTGCATRSASQAMSPDGQRLDCVTFKAARLPAGESFAAPVGGGLNVQLSDDGGRWLISVRALGDGRDFLWVVTPPFQTRPEAVIGSAYGYTARQSVQMSPRHFKFVRTAKEYEEALALFHERGPDRPSRTIDDIMRFGKGSLDLAITGSGTVPGRDALRWISVRGRACQPR